jgi:hypothetical protein
MTDKLELFDDDVPALAPGAYRITATLALPNAATDQFGRTYGQDVVVDSPQFTLPPNMLRSVFPPANANGAFGDVLPFVLLASSTLPWERSAEGDAVPATPAPWLALLVFDEAELPADPTTGSAITTETVRDLLAPVPGVYKPSITAWKLPAATLDSAVQSIVVPTGVFVAVTPRLAELRYLIHVRRVDPAPLIGEGASAVVMSSRFPRSAGPGGSRVVAHLVSLEGLADVLVEAPTWPAGTTHVQVVSLANWSFASTDRTGMTFKDLAGNLVAKRDRLRLRIHTPAKAPDNEATQRLERGYTAFAYRTPAGPETFAWYRGPFCPMPAPPLPPLGKHPRPSRLMIYDERHGVFDHSYAAAWQIGRLVALADPAFVDSASRRKRRLQRIAHRLLERAATPQLRDSVAEDRLRPDALQLHFEQRLIDGYGDYVDGVARDVGARAHDPTAAAAPLAPSDDPTPGRRREAAGAALDAAATRRALGDPAVRAILTRELLDDDGGLQEWLDQLAQLRDVPFVHLVPDQRMLPAESVRFFYVDPGWIDCLVRGALSTLVATEHDEVVVSLMHDAVRSETSQDSKPAAGMLIRSALVSGWPSLAVSAATASSEIESTLRQVGDSTLLALWPQVPDFVEIAEPHDALAFGIGTDHRSVLRSVAPGTVGNSLGPFPLQGTYEQFLRPVANGVGRGVLRVFEPAAAGWLVPELSAALGLPAGTYLSPAELAVELVQPRSSVAFKGT